MFHDDLLAAIKNTPWVEDHLARESCEAIMAFLRSHFPGFNVTLEPRSGESRMFLITGSGVKYSLAITDQAIAMVTNRDRAYTAADVEAMFASGNILEKLESAKSVTIVNLNGDTKIVPRAHS